MLFDNVRKPTKKRCRPENAIGKQIDAFLKLNGIYFRQISSTGAQLNGRWISSVQGRGISDRIGLLPNGRFLAIELKAPGKKNTLTEAQFDFLIKIISNNGLALVADSVEDVQFALENNSKESLLQELNKWVPKTELRRSWLEAR